MGAITLIACEKWFDTTQVIKGVDLTIREGELIVFVGPSGCGKSTLLRMIGGLEDISRGSIEIDGVDVSDQPPSQRGLSMVFQSYALYPHMSVRENMGFSLKTAGAPQHEIDAKVQEAARTLKLNDYLDRRPKDLSGGQRQRVAIGRSIVREPTAFLFDEPLSNLDAALRVEMRYEIAKLHDLLSATMIYVTHDQVEAMTLADRIVVLDAGNIIQVGTPRELYNSPDNTFVAQFIGSPKMNVMPCRLEAEQFVVEGGRPAAYPLRDRGASRVGIRPEHLNLSTPGSGLFDGTVEVVEYLGSDTFVVVSCASLGQVSVRVIGDAQVQTGQTVGIEADPLHIHFFDEKGQSIARIS
ncbi:MAG: ABC transporter ATP-binding protein [Granulosicoccus sp.]|nr:ABC transporter ATP-binding protein [Granulosicoccus sp.]